MSTPSLRFMARVAGIVFFFDQATKYLVLNRLGYAEERVIIPGFFKFIHVVNTGAAWSLFSGNNAILAIVALGALIVLFFARHHFSADTRLGQTALGLIFGGILGNLFDRVLPSRQHVIDFLYFYLNKPDGSERWSFPAFNIADSAICIGVGLIFLLNWKSTNDKPNPSPVTGAPPR